MQFMRKAVMSLIITALLASSSLTSKTFAADPFGFSSLFNLTSDDTLKTVLKPVFDTLATGMNTGKFAPTSVDIVGVGLTASLLTLPLTTIKNIGFSEQTSSLPDSFYIPLPMIYAGARIPVVGIRAFARGLMLPKALISSLPSDIITLGGGLGYDIGLPGLPLISPVLSLLGSYQMVGGLPYVTALSSYGAGATLAIKVNALVFSIKPFIHAGYYMGNYTVTLNAATFLAENTTLPAAVISAIGSRGNITVTDTLNQIVASAGLRFSLGPIDLFGEYAVLPKPVVTAGLGLSF